MSERRFIYADHAATTSLAPEALKAMLPFLTEQYGNPSQPYAHARAPKKAVAHAREAIAACLSAQPDEIFFTSGGSESDSWALRGPDACVFSASGIITSRIEHHAVLNACAALERCGRSVYYLGVNKCAQVSPDELKQALSEKGSHYGLVSVMTANNETGTVQPIARLAHIAHEAGAMFHTDAVQAVGHVPVDVEALNVDMVSASAHKFNGPKGMGFLYVRRSVQKHMRPLVSGGSQERGMRGGTENVAGIVGMATALELSCARMSETAERLVWLERKLLDALKSGRADFYLNTPLCLSEDERNVACMPSHLPGLLSLSFKGQSGEALLHRLDLKGIAISTGSACDSERTQFSHVVRALMEAKDKQLSADYANGTIRISLGAENSVEDAEMIAAALLSCVKRQLA